jgi:hypothetical protein
MMGEMFTFPFVLLTIPNAFLLAARKGMLVLSSGTKDTFPQNSLPYGFHASCLMNQGRKKLFGSKIKACGLTVTLNFLP